MKKRPCLKDADTIVELWKDFTKQHDTNIVKHNSKMKPYTLKKSNASKLFGKFLKTNLKSKNAIIHIAEVDGKPAGYNLCFIKDNIPVFKLEKTGHISDLFVKKEFRGRGISSMFKDKAMKWFKKKGLKYALIGVNSLNEHARSIYKKWGFVEYHLELRRKI